MTSPRDSTVSERVAVSGPVDGGLLLVAGEGMFSTYPLLRDETVIMRGCG